MAQSIKLRISGRFWDDLNGKWVKGQVEIFVFVSLQSETGSSIPMMKEWFPRSWNTYTLRDLHLSL